MRNALKSLLFAACCLLATSASWAADATFTMSSIFDGNNLSIDVTSPLEATVSTTTSKSNSKTGKLGSDGNYFQIVLKTETFSAASINGFINTGTIEGKNWGFQFSTDKGATWSSEVTQPNDGNKTAHDIAVTVTIPAGANGFRVIRRAGTSTQVNSITLTVGGSVTPPTPVAVTGVTLNKTSLTLEAGKTEQLTATVEPSNADNKEVSWSSDKESVATVDANGKVSALSAGTAKITVTTKDGSKTATCTVTVTAPAAPIAVTGISLNKSTTTIKVGQQETLAVNYTPGNANTGKAITWTSDKQSVATVANGVVTGVAPGTAVITATSEGGFTAQCTVTVEEAVEPPTPVPTTGLTLHVPEIYEAKDIAGGYNGTLRVVGGREYEVYYPGKTNDSYASVCVKPNTQKQEGMTTNTSATSTKAKDGWFEANIAGISNTTLAENAEFEAAESNVMHKMNNNNAYKFHVQGYDQFTILAKDKKLDTSSDHSKPQNNQLFDVYIDDVVQPRQSDASSVTIRRFDMSTAEHVIEVRAINSGNSELYGFSLRVAQEPRTKWLKGNDSTQVVLQTAAIKPVTYVTKYNNIPGAQTRLQWLGGKEATGIGLQKIEGALTDTLLLTGSATCPTGEYKYAVVAYYNGIETSRATGTFKVTSDIQATSDLNVEVYQGEEMDQITFKYYALSADDVQLTWTGTQPTGISGSGNNGKYIIGGTPQTTGIFPFEVTVLGADTVLKGKITVKTLNYGENSVLYLYKNNESYLQDGVYTYINGAGKWNLIARKAKEDGLRPEAQYANYKWIIVSEDADANNAEVMAVVRGGANLPVLNLKGFTYSSDRLNWGEPDNGAIDSTAAKTKGTYLHIMHPQHPIYQAKMNYLKTGDSIQILSGYETKGIMPINVDYPNSYCLGTAYTRNIEDYYQAGELQTALHEIPANKRGGHKYICLPLARQVTLSNLGKNLIDGIIAYLTSPDASGVQLPDLQINRFSIAGYDAVIDQNHSTLKLNLPIEEYDNLETAKPIVELADPNTHLVPSVEPSIDLRYAIYIPRAFVVTDYINRRTYELTIETYDPQGIEEVYAAGMWVNVYDIYGRKVTTTNENIYTMELPHGMYIVVMESGQSIKILR